MTTAQNIGTQMQEPLSQILVHTMIAKPFKLHAASNATVTRKITCVVVTKAVRQM